MLRLTKIQPAARSYGRGSDNTYRPATCQVVWKGETYTLRCRALRYMEKAKWEVTDSRHQGYGVFPTPRRACERIENI